MSDTDQTLIVDYTNWRHERRTRPIRPMTVWFGENDYHEGPQWFLKAVDLEDGEVKDFALSGMHRMLPRDMADGVTA